MLYPNIWILICPMPWLIYAIAFSCRPELSRRSALFFAGSVAVATLLLVVTIVTACALPLMAITCLAQRRAATKLPLAFHLRCATARQVSFGLSDAI